MVFSSVPFLFRFLPLVLILYGIAPRKAKNAVLLLASLAFYAWGEGRLVLLFAGTILVNWLAALGIERMRGTGWSKALLLLTVCADLGLLGIFKYADFFLENFSRLTGLSLPLLGLALPIGISFYTFQLLSYTADVYRGTAAQRNPVDFAAYVSLFPQLIAGPIVRYSDVAGQLEHRKHTLSGTAQGIRRFLIGLGKKVLIANVLGELTSQYLSVDRTVLMTWLYAVGSMLQIYYDFSGYSDMAIGLGKLFGFDFPENFNYPYIAASVTDFWRRWHRTLGSWFRDYVYIPLGGNRKGSLRQIVNILIVWMLTGLWHGAAWNFVFWGLWYAVLLTLEKLGLKKALDRHPVLGHFWTLAASLLGFLIFNAGSLAEAMQDAAGLLSFGNLPLADVQSVYLLRSHAVLLTVGIVGATPLPKKVYLYIKEKAARSRLTKSLIPLGEPVVLTLLLLTAAAYLVDGSFNPFLYFRF